MIKAPDCTCGFRDAIHQDYCELWQFLVGSLHEHSRSHRIPPATGCRPPTAHFFLPEIGEKILTCHCGFATMDLTAYKLTLRQDAARRAGA